LESFKEVVAPFDGVITARNTDIGALINAGQSAGSELFRLADTRRLRIYVQVPEPYAGLAKLGLQAQLRFSEQQGKTYTAALVRTSDALDPGLRTLQVELQLDNSGGELFPGAYAEVHFKLAGNAQSLRLPANTVLFRAAGLQVAIVDANRHIQLKSIVEGREFGTSIEVLSGLGADDSVVINPPDSIVTGATVHMAAPPPAQMAKRGATTS
jgi:RND family efflux transporter MFP subunit